jgi:hypothetical protein
MNNQTLPYNETDIESGKFHLYLYPEIQSHLKNYDVHLPITFEYAEFKRQKAYQQSYLVKDDNRHEQKLIFFHLRYSLTILFDFKNNCFQIDLMIPENYPKKFSCTIKGNRAITESLDDLTKIQ